MIRLFSALTLGLAMVFSTGVASAQAPPNPVQNGAPIVFKGSEDLDNFGRLTFTIRGAEVVMLDSSDVPIKGTASISGARHTFTFADCVYEGELVNGVIAGTARFTSGNSEGKSWTFNVRLNSN